MKYDAFISYRHAPMDIEVSELIHKSLEKIHVPGAIRKTSGKRKIERVFRDQEELTVSSSLSDEILSALDESEYLIVICSPRTPESEWVENEVSYFIKVHGREHVLPVIIEGEPKDSFPKSLLFEERREINVHGESYVYATMAEPFAADYRAPDVKSRKRKIKQDILRLAAPILGCRYDDLRQRHRDQKNRRIAIGVTTFSIMAILFGTYNYFQNQKILENFRKQQMTQSMYLADTALRLLEEGDRSNAILVARQALPVNLDHPDRPIVPQAEYALSKALNAYAIGSDLVADYTIEHHDVVTENVKCSPSGIFLALLDSRGVLNLFDMKSGHTISELSVASEDSPADRIYDFMIMANDRVVAFSGTKIICIDGSDGSVVWEVEFESLSGEFSKDSFFYAPYYAMSADETVVAIELAVSEDAYVLDTNDGRLISFLPVGNPDTSISRMALSSDGSRLAVLYSDILSQDSKAVASVFDVKAKNVVASFDLAYSGVFFAAFTADDDLVCGSYDFSDWSETSGRVNMQFSCHDISQSIVMWVSEVSPTRSMIDLMIKKVQLVYSEEAGDHILLVVENRVFILDLETGSVLTEMVAPSYITGSVMNPDTGLFIYTTDIGQVKWGNMYTGREYKEYDFLIQTEISSMVGASGYMAVVPYDMKSVMVYSYLEAPGLERLYEFDPYEYTGITLIRPDGQYILIGKNSDEATEAFIFDTVSGDLVAQTLLPDFAECAIFDESGVLFAMADGTIQYYELKAGTMTTVWENDDSYVSFYTNSDQTHFVISEYDRIRVVSAENLEIVLDMPLENEQYIAVSDDADYLLMSGNDGIFAIRIDDGLKISFEESIDLMQGFGLKIAYARDNDYVAIPGADQFIYIIDMKTGKTLSRIEGAGTDVFSGCFTNNDKALVFQSNDYRIRAASVDTGRLVYTGEDDMRPVSSWSYNSDRKILAAVTDTGALFLNVAEEIYPTADVPYFIAFSQNSDYVYFADPYMLGRFPYRELKDLYDLSDKVLGGRSLSEENRIKYYIED